VAIALDTADLGSAINDTSATSIALTTTATVAVGKFIIVAVGKWAGGDLDHVEDSAGNTYTIDKEDDDAGLAGLYICSSKVTTQLSSGGTITAVYASSTSARAVYASVFTGLKTSSWVGNTNTQREVDADTDWTTGSITRATDGELVYAAIHNDSQNTTCDATGPAADLHNFGTASISYSSAYRIFTSSGSDAISGTVGVASDEIVINGVAYLAETAAAPAPKLRVVQSNLRW
jgi:hypothetical protein